MILKRIRHGKRYTEKIICQSGVSWCAGYANDGDTRKLSYVELRSTAPPEYFVMQLTVDEWDRVVGGVANLATSR